MLFRAGGRQAPRWPFTLNRDSPLARGLTHFWTTVPGTDLVVNLVNGPVSKSTSSIPAIRSGLQGIDYTSDTGTAHEGSAGGTGLDMCVAWMSYLDGFTTGSFPYVANVKIGGVAGPWILFYSNSASYQDITWAAHADYGVGERMTLPSDIPVSGEWHWGVANYDVSEADGSQFTGYVNGQALSVTAPGGITTPTNQTRIGSRSDNALPFEGVIKHLASWNRTLSAIEAQAWYETPWDLYYELGRVFYSFPVAASCATSTGALSLPSAILAATGVLQPEATGALSLLAATIAGTGVQDIPGAGALILSASSLAVSGVQGNASTATLVLDTSILSAAGLQDIPGTATILLPDSALDAQGLLQIPSTGVLSLDVAVIDATGFHGAPEGTGVLLLNASEVNAVGVMQPDGSVVITLLAAILSAVGAGPAPEGKWFPFLCNLRRRRV